MQEKSFLPAIVTINKYTNKKEKKTMVRQKDNVAIYKVTGEKTGRIYYVELLRLQNNYYGTPRFEAHLIRMDVVEQYNYCGVFVYRFTGHYYDDINECKWIVNYHENKK